MMLSASSRFALIVAAGLLTAHDASAAFKFIAPATAPAQAAQDQSDSTTTIISSATLSNTPAAPASLPTGSVVDAGRSVAITPVMPIPATLSAPVKTMPVMPITDAPVAAGFSDVPNNTVQGFGKSVPLHIALKQIVPEGFAFGYGAGVNPAKTISWQGGQSWRETLKSSLATQGLSYREAGSVLYIQPANQTAKLQPASLMMDVATPAARALPVMGESKSFSLNAALRQAAMQPMRPVKVSASDVDDPVVIDSATLGDNGANDSAKPAVITSQKTTTTQTTVAAPTAPVDLPPPVIADAPMANSMTDSAPVPTPVVMAQQAPMASSMPPMETPVAKAQSWNATPGSTLHATLQKWCGTSNAELTWNSEYDYPIQAPIHIDGTFDDAVRTMLRGFADANPPPKGQIYIGQGKQSVLVITTPGNDYTN